MERSVFPQMAMVCRLLCANFTGHIRRDLPGVPILQERGVFRADYTGRTLRDHLGLKRPLR